VRARVSVVAVLLPARAHARRAGVLLGAGVSVVAHAPVGRRSGGALADGPVRRHVARVGGARVAVVAVGLLGALDNLAPAEPEDVAPRLGAAQAAGHEGVRAAVEEGPRLPRSGQLELRGLPLGVADSRRTTPVPGVPGDLVIVELDVEIAGPGVTTLDQH